MHPRYDYPPRKHLKMSGNPPNVVWASGDGGPKSKKSKRTPGVPIDRTQVANGCEQL